MIAFAFLAALACDGMTDDSQAWAAALQMADLGRDKTVELPAGTCVFKTAPAPITRGVSVEGQGKSSTILQCNVGGMTCIRLCDMGSTLSNFTIWAGPGANGGIGLSLLSCRGEATGNHVLEHMWITAGSGGGRWAVGLSVDGSARTVAPVGMRQVVINDVTTFTSSFWSATLWDCISCEWRGGAIHGTVAIGGARSANIRLDTIYSPSGSVIWSGVLR